MRVTIVGPAWPYRGGIAAFNERLAHQLQSEGHEVQLYTFTLQYPGFLFPGKTQLSAEPAPPDLRIERKLSSVNPFTWVSLGRRIRREAPDLLVLAYWMPFMAPCLGTVGRIAKGNGSTHVIALCHNLIPHESRPFDRLLTKYFIGSVEYVAALSQSVCDDVHQYAPTMPTVASPHPLYDNFGEPMDRAEACSHLGLDESSRFLLFFGLIRDYKGLDLLLEAYAGLVKVFPEVKLIVAGEFYSGEERYHAQATHLGIDDKVIWRTEFVSDHEVRYFFAAADLVVQPYKSATQSGVTQIAYHFQRPMLVTRVGGLPEIVPDGKVGYVVDPNPKDITAALIRFVTEHPDFSSGLASEREKYSWPVFTKNLLSLLDPTKLS
ncbi:MAG: glycosyltransferase [Bacteroidales bacterium]|nr:glycosyltransferase [Bacteroidales bacterium]